MRNTSEVSVLGSIALVLVILYIYEAADLLFFVLNTEEHMGLLKRMTRQRNGLGIETLFCESSLHKPYRW